MGKKYLLVCEGPSDISLFETIGHAVGADIIEFAPQIDATSGVYPPFGWTQVRNWCLRMGGSKSVGNPIDLLLAFRKADGLIIQMDTDIADQINIAGKNGVMGDRGWCDAAITSWLGSKGGHTKVHYVLCKHSSESWILATYPNYIIGYQKHTLRDYESIPDPQTCLMGLGYKRKRGALVKSYEQYKKLKYAPRVVAHLTKAMARCAELERFVKLCI